MDGKLRNMTGVYITYENKVLLLYRQGGRVVNNAWTASAGGHFEEYELNNAKACALRELKEETGITEAALKNVAMRYVTLRRTNGEIRQNYYFFAELCECKNFEFVSNEGVLKWFDISEIHTLEMPYTARYVIEHYLKAGRFDDKVYAGIADGEQVIFAELPEY